MTDTMIRHAVHPEDVKSWNTAKLREHFLISDLFIPDTLQLTYSEYDRFIVGGVLPVSEPVLLDSIPVLRAAYFLERREIGIINVGAPAVVIADEQQYLVGTREALYLGRGIQSVIFKPAESGVAKFYFNSATAHKTYPSRKISIEEAETAQAGSPENSNVRLIRKLIVGAVLPTCQLQMGLTELNTGSVWNTMPPHTHDRRMETYFYFDVPSDKAVCHLMGEPDETRCLWVKNQEAVISPPWSIHSGAGTSSYSFIWGMAGENLDYSDMDPVAITDLK